MSEKATVTHTVTQLTVGLEVAMSIMADNHINMFRASDLERFEASPGAVKVYYDVFKEIIEAKGVHKNKEIIEAKGVHKNKEIAEKYPTNPAYISFLDAVKMAVDYNSKLIIIFDLDK